ncbi:MAG: DUF3050 domain-containing protein, partial [Gammaproteobacteria bacterium]|nr:DUF3050 domain-containing protein [Gammaproteobacteria bacterium]
HIFSVWGFMSILKSLQFSLSRNSLPWVPTENTRNGLTSFINEIVLSEESDYIEGIGYISHFEIYLEAMKEIGADSSKILELIDCIYREGSAYDVINNLDILDEVKDFIKFDLDTALSGDLPKIVGSFTLGREKVIPNMFEHIVQSVADASATNKFTTYLNRHIDIDGDRHGPLSSKLLDKLCCSDKKLEVAYQAGVDSLNLRLKVWDKISDNMGLDKI